jgi:YgiT-type zinc finger domain-containing protein
MAAGLEGQEAKSMRCERCGAELAAVTTDLPFKVREPGIVILKGVPALQCARCPQYLLEDHVLGRVDEILRRVDGEIELEVVRYAA